MTWNPPDNRESPEYRLSRYLDGQLEDAARAELERELAADPELAARLAELRRVDAWVRAWGERLPVTDAEAFVARARLRRERSDAGRRVVRLYRWMAPLAAAAAIALVVTGLMVVRSGLPRESQTQGPMAAAERRDSVVVEPERPEEPSEKALVIVSFSRAEAAEERDSEGQRSRLMVTTGVMVSADTGPAAADAPLF